MISFSAVTAYWTAKIFILYTVLVLALPYLVLRKFLKGKSFTQKFIICVVFGNFFYITLVLLWGLFHITNRYVLALSTLLIPAAMVFRIRREIWERYLRRVWVCLGRFARRENSLRYIIKKAFRSLRRHFRSLMRRTRIYLAANLPELILFSGYSLLIIWYFSSSGYFGPKHSDLSVHMYWINQMDKGILFCEGVYPFGMHALIYYIHAVFDIPTVRLLLCFGATETFFIFTMLLIFLKKICRFRYTPYIGYFLFAAGSFREEEMYARYYSALPQEFGMIFLLPCAVALINFFRAQEKEKREYERRKTQKLLYTRADAKQKWKESTLWLWVLIISFGLTLSAHFYITILAGLLMLAGAIAYIRFLFDWKTVRRLAVAALLAVAIPVFPMVAAFATGTPLQASLYWAMGIIRSDETAGEEAETAVDGTPEANETEVTADSIPEADETETAVDGISEADETEMTADGISETNEMETDGLSAQGDTVPMQEEPDAPKEQVKLSFTEKITSYAERVWKAADEILRIYIFTEEQLKCWLGFMAAFAALVPLMWIFREWEYSRRLLMVLIYTGILMLLCISERVGLPALLQEIRSAIFFCYTALICFSVVPDGLLVILSRAVRKKRVWDFLSLAICGVLIIGMTASGSIRKETASLRHYESNGAAVCVYDIMEHYPERKWTIVSCNEERNMIASEGWHYEVIDFLWSMEPYNENTKMRIPTQYVFFFIEKESLNYVINEESITYAGLSYEDVDPTVSEKWASEKLPVKNGLVQYSAIERIVLNSRMYYWALEYQKRFPNEMKVYYEDDEFICFYIEQNEYYLNNFAIDYGYNSGG